MISRIHRGFHRISFVLAAAVGAQAAELTPRPCPSIVKPGRPLERMDSTPLFRPHSHGTTVIPSWLRDALDEAEATRKRHDAPPPPGSKFGRGCLL